MKKKFLLLLTTVILSTSLAFSACGEENKDKTSDTSDSPVPEEPNTPNTPSTPSTPDTPLTPDTPGTPSTPDTSDKPDNPDTPEEPAVYTVTFDSQGGSDIKPQQVTEGDYAIQPDRPEKEGKVFLYWSDTIGGERFLFSAHIITEDIILYAVWSDYHTVTFDSQGGSAVEEQQVADGGYAIQPSRPEKEGAYFLHWSETIGGERFLFTSRIITEDITLYAVWNEAYTVTFDTQGGSNIPAQYVSPNTSARNPDSPTREGYNFLGWYTAAEGGVEWKWNDPVTGDITVYAHWESDTATDATASLEYTYDNTLGGYVVTGVGQESDLRIPAEYNGTRGTHAVVGIGSRAFYNKRITSVELPASLLSIGTNAFTRTDLTSVTIPANVTTLGNYAFSQCSRLTAVTFAAGSRLISIGQRAFADDPALLELTIPASVTSIGGSLIRSSGVTTIHFLGTRSAWDAVAKEGWDTGTTDVTVICLDDQEA